MASANWTPKQKNIWTTRLWFAKEFGWSEKDLEEISYEYARNLIRIHNMLESDKEFARKVNQAKGKRR